MELHTRSCRTLKLQKLCDFTVSVSVRKNKLALRRFLRITVIFLFANCGRIRQFQSVLLHSSSWSTSMHIERDTLFPSKWQDGGNTSSETCRRHFALDVNTGRYFDNMSFLLPRSTVIRCGCHSVCLSVCHTRGLS